MTALDLLKIDTQPDPQRVTLLYLKSIYDATHIVGLSWLGVSVGRHRAGKSVGTLAVSNILDKTFWDELEFRVVYSPKDFLKSMRRIRKQETIGAVTIWDEAGVGLPARDWYDISNKSVNYALQVAGYLRPIIFFVTQDFSYIDGQARKLIQHFWEFRRSSTTYSVVTPNVIAHNRRTGDVYFMYPRIVMRYGPSSWGSKMVLTSFKVFKPPQELIDRYIIHSEPWKDKIIRRAEEKAKAFEEGDLEKREWTTGQIIDYLVAHWRAYQNSRSRPDRPLLDPYLIKMDFNIPLPLAKAIKSRVENILLEEIQKKGKPPEEKVMPYDKR